MNTALCVLLTLLGVALPSLSLGQAPPAEDEFIYSFQARDTLIHVSRRLLLQPQRWPELQRRNGIRDPFNIAPGTPVRIPYSWLRLSTANARIIAVNGSVLLGAARPAVGDSLQQGAVLRTGDDGSVALEFADGSVVTLQKASMVTLDQMQRVDGVAGAHSIQLRLNSGRIATKANPRREVGRFEILTPVAISAVRGTQFRSAYEVDGSNATSETLEGDVSVAASARQVLVPAGFGTQVDRRGTPLPPVALLPAPDLSTVPQRNTQRNLVLQLQPIDGAASYRVQLASDSQFHSIVFDRESPQLSYDIPDLADGNYWLRARAIDANRIEGSDAARELVQHLLPAAPSPVAPQPDQRIVGTAAELSWGESPGVASYHVQLARDEQFAELALDRDDVQATRLTVASLPPGRYFWRVGALSADGERGAWSSPRSFVQRAAAPQMEQPELSDRKLRLRWQPRPENRYQLQLARDEQFTRLVVSETVTASELTMKQPRPGRYYVRVRTIDADGVPDEFSEPLRFVVPMPGWLQALISSSMLLPLL
ncbi:MAG: FecR domain-containing protein [Pseudomonadota bacterium]|nr:FecR domain-containing protein [Pseudomonadota bacterium]